MQSAEDQLHKVDKYGALQLLLPNVRRLQQSLWTNNMLKRLKVWRGINKYLTTISSKTNPKKIRNKNKKVIQ